MYLYNVTLKVEMSIADEWVSWMRKTHIPAVMATGYFAGYQICRLLDDGDLDGITFIVQYECTDLNDFLQYQAKEAATLQKEHREKFGDQVVAFRTIMEKLD